MSRYSYDDMPPEGYRERRRGNGRMTAAIAAIGVLLTLIAIIIYLLFTPHNTVNESPEPAIEAVSATPAEPEIITPAERKVETVPSASEVETAEIETPETEEIREAEIVSEVAEAETVPAVTEEPETETEEIEIIEDIVAEPAEEIVYDPLLRFQEMGFSSYEVKNGDTLQSIADTTGLSTTTLVSVNKLKGTALESGTTLLIPPVEGTLYTMEEGDDLASVVSARNPQLTASDVAIYNKKESTACIPGEEIFIPAPGTVEETVSYMFSSPLPGGEIIARFGDYIDGQPLDGVAVAAAPGSAVVASSDGTVVDIFADPEFGRSVKLLHSDGYTSSYSALETVSVKVSQKVNAGNIIGAIGTSNLHFSEPAVVFSVEQNGVSLDPVNLTQF